MEARDWRLLTPHLQPVKPFEDSFYTAIFMHWTHRRLANCFPLLLWGFGYLEFLNRRVKPRMAFREIPFEGDILLLLAMNPCRMIFHEQ